MIKYIGMILIAVSCTAGGFFISDGINRRLRQTESFIRFFDYIIKYIEIYRYPMEKIFACYADTGAENCGFVEKLLQNGRVNGVYANPWEISLEECRDLGLVSLKGEEYEIIKEFGINLGNGRAEEQISRMNLYREKLSKLYEEEYAKEVNRSKLCKVSGGLFGVFLCILLL